MGEFRTRCSFGTFCKGTLSPVIPSKEMKITWIKGKKYRKETSFIDQTKRTFVFYCPKPCKQIGVSRERPSRTFLVSPGTVLGKLGGFGSCSTRELGTARAIGSPWESWVGFVLGLT